MIMITSIVEQCWFSLLSTYNRNIVQNAFNVILGVVSCKTSVFAYTNKANWSSAEGIRGNVVWPDNFIWVPAESAQHRRGEQWFIANEWYPTKSWILVRDIPNYDGSIWKLHFAQECDKNCIKLYFTLFYLDFMFKSCCCCICCWDPIKSYSNLSCMIALVKFPVRSMLSSVHSHWAPVIFVICPFLCCKCAGGWHQQWWH